MQPQREEFPSERAIMVAFKGKLSQRSIRTLSFLLPLGKKCSECDVDAAAKQGYLAVVKYLYARGKRCSPDSTVAAVAANRDLEMLMFLLTHDTRGSITAANWAARSGHIYVLRVMFAKGVRCDAYGANQAARYGHLDVLQLLWKHNIRCTRQGLKYALDNNHWHVSAYLESLGYTYGR